MKTDKVISIAVAPIGGIFATGSGDQKARIWKFNIQRPHPPLASLNVTKNEVIAEDSISGISEVDENRSQNSGGSSENLKTPISATSFNSEYQQSFSENKEMDQDY